jgi:F0F1-type ATP synthase membrane subunit b/b'
MDNDKALEHLLQIETKAAALVDDAQAEADRRIAENEKGNRELYEERFKVEAEARETALRKEKDRLRKQYQKELDDYRKEISGINADFGNFSALFSKFYAGEG